MPTVSELKEMLRKRGLKVSGRKDELIARLASSRSPRSKSPRSKSPKVKRSKSRARSRSCEGKVCPKDKICNPRTGRCIYETYQAFQKRVKREREKKREEEAARQREEARKKWDEWFARQAKYANYAKYNTYGGESYNYIPQKKNPNAEQILKSFGITDKASFKKWIISNHPDKNPAPGQTEKFQTVFKLWKQVNE